MKRKTAIAAAALLASASGAQAAVQTQEIEYEQGGTTLQGFLARDAAAKDKRPGILVVHEWWGHNEHARNQAKRLAEEGYVAFALDMYGKGKVATHPEDAQAFMQEVTKDQDLVAARFDAALEVLKRQPGVDPEKIGVVGYCMGGTIALAMARAGADVDAVATFHAGLKPPGAPAEKGKFKPDVLVQTGGADPMVPDEQVAAFKKEMKAAGVDAEVVVYPGAKHSFTNPNAGTHGGMEGLAYDKKADEQSWQKLTTFLKKVFKDGRRS